MACKNQEFTPQTVGDLSLNCKVG